MGAVQAPGTAPAQGTPPAGAQPPASGQGDPGQGATGGSGFNWGLFPNVPEEQRPLLEPHLKDTLGHVTKLEQQYAPYKPVIESGLAPDQIQGLVQFARNYDANPMQVWLQMATQLQEQGVLHADLDLEAVQAAAQGQELEGGDVDESGDQPWQQEIAQLKQRLDQSEQARQQEASQRQQRVEDQLLQRALDKAKNGLKEAGVVVPEEGEEAQRFERLLVSSIITNNGDSDAAVASLMGFRDSNLKGFTNQKTGQKPELTMPKGTPPVAPKQKSPRDAFEAARPGAENLLKSFSEADAQE